MTATNEIVVWLDGAPVVALNSNREFDIWLDGVPVLDIDEGGLGIDTARRRVAIF